MINKEQDSTNQSRFSQGVIDEVQSYFDDEKCNDSPKIKEIESNNQEEKYKFTLNKQEYIRDNDGLLGLRGITVDLFSSEKEYNDEDDSYDLVISPQLTKQDDKVFEVGKIYNERNKADLSKSSSNEEIEEELNFQEYKNKKLRKKGKTKKDAMKSIKEQEEEKLESISNKGLRKMSGVGSSSGLASVQKLKRKKYLFS